MPSNFMGWVIAGAGLVLGATAAAMAMRALGMRTGAGA